MADNGSVLFIVFGKICDNKALSLCRGFSDALGSDAIAFRIAFRIALFFFLEICRFREFGAVCFDYIVNCSIYLAVPSEI